MADTTVSQLWSELTGSLFGRVDDEFLTSFRAPGGANNRLAAWDAMDGTARYFKFLLFALASARPGAFFDQYEKLGDVDLGAPTAVTVRGCRINIDYYLSVDELLFLQDAADLSNISSVLEIGAGFGRTCHTILCLTDVSRYVIVDLPEVLNLSSQYLRRVLPSGQYRKIEFINAHDTALWTGVEADLSINIDSFQEMPPETIRNYSQNLLAYSRFHYCKNPIAKYSPVLIGLAERDVKAADVFALGLCRNVIDIYDDRALDQARQDYIEAYCPGSGWSVRASRPLDIFPYLQHALFENGNR